MKPAATFPPGSLAALILGAILMAIVVPVHAEPQTGALEIVSPKGGGRWAAGSQHYILWKSSLAAPDQNPRAEYTTDNGEHWRKLPARAAGAGRILWHLPNLLFPQCRVRVFDPRGGASGESKD
ncbi:hypothetical protein HQ590_07745, partial [bacterium]|nr:hypothetical protein [bacterium]